MIQADGPRLSLYETDFCYYCVSVRREANHLGVPLKVINIHEDRAARRRLLDATGRTRVPVLGIDRGDGLEEFLPESQDIIRFLRELSAAATKEPVPPTHWGPGQDE